MRQLLDLINSIAGSAAPFQPGSQPAGGSEPSASTSDAACSVRRTSSASDLSASSRLVMRISPARTMPAGAPPPLSAAAAAAFPALRAAEAALEAQLADRAAACDRDYLQLHILNERLVRQNSFRAAQARRDLNRYCDVLPYDGNRVHLGQPGAASPADRQGGLGGSSSSSSAGGRREAGASGAAASDYINASPLLASSQGDVPWAYVACQGPLKHTRDAFWQMAVEQRCSAVVMLTNTVERGMPKCAAYFAAAPRTAKNFGRFTVSTLSTEQLLPDLERRLLAVKDTQAISHSPLKRPLDEAQAPAEQQQQQQDAHGRQRTEAGQAQAQQQLSSAAAAGRQRPSSFSVPHYHYTAWPDHGVPTSPEPLLRLCAELRSAGAHEAPVLVHCSAGIGRSGVFCVLDVATRRLLHLLSTSASGSSSGSPDQQSPLSAAATEGGSVAAAAPDAAAAAGAAAVDVTALVSELRRQRMGMVQTKEQFVFCHSALLHFVRQLAAELAAAGGHGGSGPASPSAC